MLEFYTHLSLYEVKKQKKGQRTFKSNKEKSKNYNLLLKA